MNETLTRRNFLIGAGIVGAATGANALFHGSQAFAEDAEKPRQTEQLDNNPYSFALGNDVNMMPAYKTSCPGPSGPISFEERDIDDSEIASSEDCDILIIGLGIGGLIASLKAATEGANVITLEKMTKGRSTWESFGACGSKLQKDLGVECNPAELVNEIQRASYWRTRPEPIQTYVSRSGEVADFWQKMFEEGGDGFEIVRVPPQPSTQEFKALDSYLSFKLPEGTSDSWLYGPYVHRELCKVANNYSNLQIKYRTPAVQLVQDENGRVTGCIAKSDNGDYLRFNASKGVLLATGGYDANPKMMEAWIRPEDYATSSWWNPNWGTTGDGHMMGLRVGAQMDSLPHPVMNFSYGVPGQPNTFTEQATLLPAVFMSILVNRDGNRFVSEDLPMQCISNAINAQPDYGKNCWHIFDRAMIADFLAAGGDEAASIIKTYEERGWLHEAQNVEDLAEKINVPVENLVTTVSRYNGFFEDKLERDTDFYRYLPATVPFTGGTYYAITTNSIILATVGGLTVDGHARVLDRNNYPIEGLYAAGNVSGSFFTTNYPRHIAGVSVGRAAVFGYVAVEEMLK